MKHRELGDTEPRDARSLLGTAPAWQRFGELGQGLLSTDTHRADSVKGAETQTPQAPWAGAEESPSVSPDCPELETPQRSSAVEFVDKLQDNVTALGKK